MLDKGNENMFKQKYNYSISNKIKDGLFSVLSCSPLVYYY